MGPVRVCESAVIWAAGTSKAGEPLSWPSTPPGGAGYQRPSLAACTGTRLLTYILREETQHGVPSFSARRAPGSLRQATAVLAAAGDSAMGRHGACPPGCLLDENTFAENYMNQISTRKTYLCYKVEILGGDARVPPDESKGFVQNKGANEPGWPRHAELYFLDRIRSWNLDPGLRYRLTCFISWTPCHTCAQELATFLGENSHLSLHIFASRIYSLPGYEAGLRTLQAAGAQIAIMTSQEFEHCWKNFVDHQGRTFEPWDELEVVSQHLCKKLQEILQALCVLQEGAHGRLADNEAAFSGAAKLRLSRGGLEPGAWQGANWRGSPRLWYLSLAGPAGPGTAASALPVAPGAASHYR
ncbi:PREDICTED: DNA dC-_dU-editing enzyme APOBEC-3G [Lipotes vexillifer]|uniref:DNA dC->dU-editing enzyme APOBEC-3G n=1 Tax=Lipotes vexillifer TaxID=118797 RepID=A0A340WXU3_LIPVE|nr:PREDICTED: DNA dC->dU-editing enzyme APOBEC-3G [Lipotes vexillifer]